MSSAERARGHELPVDLGADGEEDPCFDSRSREFPLVERSVRFGDQDPEYGQKGRRGKQMTDGIHDPAPFDIYLVSIG